MIEHPSDYPRIVVAGHLVHDEIVLPGGCSITALGGISYNLAALCSAMSAGNLIVLCEIGTDIKPVFDNTFKSCDIMDRSLIRTTNLPNVVNRLVYDSHGSRTEWNSRVPGGISLINAPRDIDAVLLNFISGDDISLEELRLFGDRFGGIIYEDFHSLSLGRNPDGSRYFRKNPNWREYVSIADIVQLNLAELGTITGKNVADVEEAVSDCEVLHQAGPENVVVTMGDKGSVLSMESGKRKYQIPVNKIEKEVDATGCGDTLAAVALYQLIKTGNLLFAVSEGCRWAAAKATFSGISGFVDISGVLDRVGPTSRPVEL
jgi:hypothetical protein